MKKIILSVILCASVVNIIAQSISFPTPELRVDTIKPLEAYGITFPRPTTMVNKLIIKGTRVPPTFYLQIVDSLGYNRFGITKNGMLITGTHHDPEVEIDALFLMGRANALKGPDSFVAGKGVINQADTAGAIGYYFTQSKNNSLTVGYGDNRIEMSADSGRFIGKWKLGTGSGGITTETDPTVPSYVKSITTANIASWNAPAWASVTGKPTFATVATSGSYNDLSNQPTIPAAQVNADWNASTGVAVILNKPTIPAVYTLPAATVSTLGGIKVGSGLNVTADGTLTASGVGTETDPTVPDNVKAITATNITNWNTAFTNNHTHTNKTVLDGITATNVTNWNTAFGWGNHATAGYLTSESDPTVPSYVKSITTANIAAWNAPAWASVTGKPTFATVATSGSYNDLSNQPTIPAAQVNADWNASTGVAVILNKPTIPSAYTLPAATASTLGGIKVGSGLSVTADGTLSSSGGSSYTLPVATTAILGGVVADANVSITAGGTMIPRKMVNTDVTLEAAADRLSIINTSGSSYTTGLDILADRITATVDGGSTYFTIPMQIYKTASEPDIPSNSFAFWVTGGVDFWLILDSNGTQKKIQLQ